MNLCGAIREVSPAARQDAGCRLFASSGPPLREALGHNSKAVHHAYSKHAEVTVPSLDDWEKGWAEKLKAETLKPEMPKSAVVQVDFGARVVAAVSILDQEG